MLNWVKIMVFSGLSINIRTDFFLIFFFPSFAPDFGMTGEFKEELRDGFIQACLHLVNRDFDALSKDFVTLGYLFLFTFIFSH